MTTTAEDRGWTREVGRQTVSHEGLGTRCCRRCGGLMVSEFCLDVFNSAGELDVMASRCVLCGDVVDPVILQNRKRQQETLAAKTSLMSVQSVGSQVPA